MFMTVGQISGPVFHKEDVEVNLHSILSGNTYIILQKYYYLIQSKLNLQTFLIYM